MANILYKKDVLQAYAHSIEKLIEFQINHEFFKLLRLTDIEIIRAKICLAIYNLSYFVFNINGMFSAFPEIVKEVINTTYTSFRSRLEENLIYKKVAISDIVISLKEQEEFILRSQKFEPQIKINDITSPYNIFEVLLEIRVPLYLKKISESQNRLNESIPLAFLPVGDFFLEMFLNRHDKDLLINFEHTINTETYATLINMVVNNRPI